MIVSTNTMNTMNNQTDKDTIQQLKQEIHALRFANKDLLDWYGQSREDASVSQSQLEDLKLEYKSLSKQTNGYKQKLEELIDYRKKLENLIDRAILDDGEYREWHGLDKAYQQAMSMV